MREYLNYLQRILDEGVQSEDRTGTGTISKFGERMIFDLTKGFPLVTTKKVHFKGVKGELLWFLEGNTNAHELRDRFGSKIWMEWANPDGELGPVYGKQWRSWEGANGNTYDQISDVMRSLKHEPFSRRHVVSAWNVDKLEAMALVPCHLAFQFYVRNGELSCQMYQRSADSFLGVPFNIASYALLTMMVAHQLDLTPKEFIWVGGDCHIYNNHIDQIKEQLTREPKELPRVNFQRKPASIFDYKMEDIVLVDYYSHPKITGEVAV